MISGLLQSCVLCGHRCGIDRIKGLRGKCQGGIMPVVASHCVHHGEEPMISGRRGSGTIFFTNCCLKCVYCQNYDISQLGNGREVEIAELAGMMLALQTRGVHNINLVSPTHYAPQILEALSLARSKGLKLPIVYNTGGFDSLELLKAIAGKIEIYMPDFKYFNDEQAFKYSGARNYVETAKAGIAEMYRQVGHIELDREGAAVKGLLVRHLVLPHALADSAKALDYLAALSKDIWVSLMAQYSPQFKAPDYPELARRLTAEEYRQVTEQARQAGLHNLYVQELGSSEVYLPDFQRDDPFSL